MAVLEAKLRDLESESSYSPQVVSLALSDSSATSDSSFEEPIVNLSAEMHNTLYVVPKKYQYTPHLIAPKHSNFYQTSSAMLFLHRH